MLTVHKSKRLEFHTTYLKGLNEGVLPDYRTTEANMFEEDYNVHIAFSRAKRRRYIDAVRYRMMPWSSLKFQFEIYK